MKKRSIVRDSKTEAQKSYDELMRTKYGIRKTMAPK